MAVVTILVLLVLDTFATGFLLVTVVKQRKAVSMVAEEQKALAAALDALRSAGVPLASDASVSAADALNGSATAEDMAKAMEIVKTLGLDKI